MSSLASRFTKMTTASLLFLFANMTVAKAGDHYVTLNDAINLKFESPVGTVFISEPAIADYKVIDKHTLVLFGRQVGQARVMVYDKSGAVLKSDRIHVDINLSRVRRQINLHYPDLAISLVSVGEEVAVRGKVYNEAQRDGIYRMVATMLGREKIERYGEARYLEFASGISESPEVSFARNYTYQGIIEGLELFSVQQVNVKISVAQVTEEFNETLGIDWSYLGKGTGVFNFTKFRVEDLSAVINAMANDSMAQVLAEPNLTVMSGESASFLVGGEVPVIVTSATSTNISFKEFGVKLDLSAKVLAQDKVRLYLAPEVSAVERMIESVGIQVPQLSSRKAATTVELADGESFMLGGLMSSDDLEQARKLPFLGDIPVLGAFFKAASTTRKKTELLIVATVNLVKPVEPRDVVLPYARKTSTMSRLFNIAPEKTGDARVLEMLAEGGFSR